MKLFSFNFAIVFSVLFLGACVQKDSESEYQSPNVVFVFADEWRGQAIGYGGNKDVLTPHLDQLATSGINLTNAISGCPVCSPYRASLLTGQYQLTNGVFVNDVLLNPEANTIAKVYKKEGYKTAYIGKWHLDGHGRSALIPKERRQGFDYWKVLECTHDYFNSKYWDNNDKMKVWDGYDAIAQTRDAISYITDRKESDIPFFLMLSWGPPHTPFFPAPKEFLALYNEKELQVRRNVPEDVIEKTKKQLSGYYAHISALDYCIGELQEAIKGAGMEKNTLFVFTSDHGHLLNSHGLYSKQLPHEESIHVPFLIKYPALLGTEGHTFDMLLNTPDIMPTLLSLCNISIPESVEGDDLSGILTGKREDNTDAVLISCPHPFGQWRRNKGGKEYRGVRTKRYTYTCDVDGPWLLFDNKEDPYQLNNLIDDKKYHTVRIELHRKMQELLDKTNDDFLPGMEYIRKWGYDVDETETVPYVR